ncbi:GUN4 domain-containing protein [Microcoleus sp. BR0-C5]|uniref:GUN4 domain-containing protein n=1 Tax=Microcoleus sp. BR0-C5 TaxID=2818713 RepID=UPI002FCF3AE8
MKFRSCWLIFPLIGLSLTSCSQPKSSQEIAETVNKSLVLIYYENQGGHGTGFFVPGKKGVCTVLTAGHVVKGYSLKLQTYQDKQSHKTDSIQTSPNFDLAVVTFKYAGENCPYPSVNFGNSNDLKVGHKIYVYGFPVLQNEDLAPEFLEGSVSRINVVLTEGYGINYTAQVSVGISGAPVLDASGKVVAVHGQAKDKLPRGIPIQTYLANQSWENQPIAKADYTKLEQLLAAGQWKEADRETANKMLEVAGRQKEGWLDMFSVKNFSCPDLRAMDRLWVKYSDRRFGFSVQNQIYQSLGGTKEYDDKVWRAYAEAIGWKQKDKGEKEGEWVLYSQETFNTNGPSGHLPRPGGEFPPSYRGRRLGVDGWEPFILSRYQFISIYNYIGFSLMQRLVNCNL